MTKDEFEKLDEKSKRRVAQKALAWFCVVTTMGFLPYLNMVGKEESETVEIILGKYINEELVEVVCDSEKEGKSV